MSAEQETFALAMFLKPFVAVVFLLIAVYLSKVILRFIPEGRVKRLLTRRIGP